MDAGIGFIAADIYCFRIFRASQLAHDVLGKVDQNRSRTPCSGDIKSLLDDAAQILTVAHCHAVFRNAPGNSYDIHFLKSVVSDQMFRHLACETDKGDTVIVGCGKTCNKVRRARSAGHQTYAHFSRCSGVGVRLVNKGLLMTGKDDLNIILFI